MTRRTVARDRILRATIDTLAKQGFAAATARGIAATGGFAAGAIYYHYEDREDLLLAALRHTSDGRIARYTERLTGVTTPAALIATIRELYDEDVATGHVAAVQELVAGAVGTPRLAAGVLAEIRRWEDFTESLLDRVLGDSPLAAVVPKRELATTVMAFYLGLEMLTHLDGDRGRGDAIFAAVLRLGPLLDTLLPGAGEP